MNVWRLTGAKKLVLSDEPTPSPEEGKLKVRITKVLLGDSDTAVYNGNAKVKYPLIPGKYAIGMIAEESGNSLFPKGTRVALHAFMPAPDTGTTKKDFEGADYLICGQDSDGFLRDIVYRSPDDITPLPDSVGDNQALLLHYVAFAKAAVDTLSPGKGKHIAVVGANLLGILICQLLIYQQTAPILIDSNEARLNFARNAGVYYTLLADDTLMQELGNITGGRLADGAVYVTGASGNEPDVALRCCAREKNVIVCGLPPCTSRPDMNISLGKKLTISFIPDCVDYIETAINLFANKAVNIECFRSNSAKEGGVDALVTNYFARDERDTMDFSYIDLL